MLETDLTADEKALAENWYGYGRWSAPYWFIGMEPADSDIGACVRMWKALGQGELLDIAAYREANDHDWFSEATTHAQRTWEKLIWTMLAYRGEDPTSEAVLAFQKKQLGRIDSDNALIELSSIPSKTIAEERPRALYREQRIRTIRDRLTDQVRWVLFYSDAAEYKKVWNDIAGVDLQPQQPMLVGSTAFVVMPHPQRERAKTPWVIMGQRLRELVPPGS